MLEVSKSFSFCYSHRLPGYNGKCAEQHGHNAEFVVYFQKVPGSYPTMVVDFNEIKKIVGPIIEKLDHKDLTGFFDNSPECVIMTKNEYGQLPESIPATAETILTWLVAQIGRTRIGKFLVGAKLSETPTSWAYWTKPKIEMRKLPLGFPFDLEVGNLIPGVGLNSLDDLFEAFTANFTPKFATISRVIDQTNIEKIADAFRKEALRVSKTGMLTSDWKDNIEKVIRENT